MNDNQPIDRFRLVRRGPLPEDREAARGRLIAQPPSALSITDHRAAADKYRMDDELETAVNMALAVGEPLLVTGDPGTGKTQLAWFLGRYFDIEVRPFHVKSTSHARDLKWEFDAVGYLQSAYAAAHLGGDGDAAGADHPEGNEPPPRRSRSDFLTPGPLWQAYEDPHPSVLLIDEIDKAPRDFPNDLLHELDQNAFEHPFEGREIRPRCPRPPIVVITSNVERELPAPFLRRCVFHHIELTEALVKSAVAARGRDFPNLEREVEQRAIDRFWEIRGRQLKKAPATGELLVWLSILDARGIEAEELERPLHRLPALGALVKDIADRKRLE